MCVPKTDILVSYLTGSMNELLNGLVDESSTNRLDERMDINSWVVNFEVPGDVCIRISFILRDAVYPDSQTAVFCRNLLLRKKQQVLPKR